MTVRVLPDQSVNIGPLVRVLYFGPCFVLWSVFCTLVRVFMAVRNQSVTVRVLSITVFDSGVRSCDAQDAALLGMKRHTPF